ncbi:MAG: hypothetical protein Kow0059_10260 [Candidatus Sumerlaeia bacterium]
MDELPELKQQLQRFLLEQRPAEIASVYRKIIAREPDFCLVPGVQFDLGRCLERAGFPGLALDAFSKLIARYPDAPISTLALLPAARLCAFLPGEAQRGQSYLDRFLQTNPPEVENNEARRLLAALRGEQPLNPPSPIPKDAEEPPSIPPRALSRRPAPSHKDASAPAVRSSSPLPPPAAPPPAIPPATPVGRASGSKSDSDVLLKEPEIAPPGAPMVHLNLEELQHALAPTPPVSRHPFIDELESEVSGHEMFFDLFQEQEEDSDLPPSPPAPRASQQSLQLSDVVIEWEAPPNANADAPASPGSQQRRPQSPSQFLRHAEQLQQQHKQRRRMEHLDRLERVAAAAEKSFAIILPLHRPIHPRRLARLLAPYLDRTPQRVLDIMKNGKGLLFENLNLSLFQDLVKITRPLSPELVYVQIPPSLRFNPPFDVIRLDIQPGRIEVVCRDRRLEFPWEDVLLVGCGRVYLDDLRRSGKNVLDLYVRRGQTHLRLWDATFQYKASGFPYDPLSDRNFASLLARIAGAAPSDVRFSPTAMRMLGSGDSTPQRFESLNSYDRYNRWLLYTFYAVKVKI